MSSSNGTDATPHYRTIFEMSPAELEVIMQDVAGYLNGLRAAHIGWAIFTTLVVWDIIRTMDREIHYVWKSRWSYAKLIFLANRYMAPITCLLDAILLFRTPSSWNLYECTIPAWFWIIFCTLTVTTVSFVLGSRVWAVYERDRRVLVALIIGFLACFVPSWTLTFLASARSPFTMDELRVWGNVWLYIGGVVTQEGVDGLDWRLRKCYRWHYPKATNSIVIGSLAYESGICAAMVWKMYQDKKKTRIIEALFRDGVVYYLVMFCTYGAALALGYVNDPIVQGFLTCGFYTIVKSMVCSHIILRLRSYFSNGDPIIDGYDKTDLFEAELGGKVDTSSSFVSTVIHFAQGPGRSGGGDIAFELRSKSEQDAASRFQVLPVSPRQQELDWTDTPEPHRPRSLLGEPSGSHLVVSSALYTAPPRKRQQFRGRPQSGNDRHHDASVLLVSEGRARPLSTQSSNELNMMVPSNGVPTARRTASETNLRTGDDLSEQLPSRDRPQFDVRQGHVDASLPNSNRAGGNEE